MFYIKDKIILNTLKVQQENIIQPSIDFHWIILLTFLKFSGKVLFQN